MRFFAGLHCLVLLTAALHAEPPEDAKWTPIPESFVMPEDASRHFHVYGLEWDINFIRWHLDGKLVRKQENTHWRQTLHHIFDTEIMAGWFGLPDKTFSSQHLRNR